MVDDEIDLLLKELSAKAKKKKDTYPYEKKYDSIKMAKHYSDLLKAERNIRQNKKEEEFKMVRSFKKTYSTDFKDDLKKSKLLDLILDLYHKENIEYFTTKLKKTISEEKIVETVSLHYFNDKEKKKCFFENIQQLTDPDWILLLQKSTKIILRGCVILFIKKGKGDFKISVKKEETLKSCSGRIKEFNLLDTI